MREKSRPPAPKKRFGQHFLESAWAEKLLGVIKPAADEAFIEIGPGRGALTKPLAARSAGVVAVEIDRDMASALTRLGLERVAIVEDDVLSVDPSRLTRELAAFPGAHVRIVGNLPYNIAAPILFRLLDWIDTGLPSNEAIVMMQREVADRLLASPGTHEYGVLNILVGYRASVTRLLDVPPGAFRPMPKVHSTVLRLVFHPPDPPAADPAMFASLVRAVFTRRRKTMANALQAYEPASRYGAEKLLEDAGIEPRRRPETLTRTEFVRLADLTLETVL